LKNTSKICNYDKKYFIFVILVILAAGTAIFAPIRWEPGLSFWYQIGFPFVWREDAFSDLGYRAVHSRNYAYLVLNLLINVSFAIVIGFLVLFLKKKFWKNKNS